MKPKPVKAKNANVREEGAVLLLVLLILTLISLLALSWAQEWRTELKLANNFSEAHKCQRLAEAGIYYALGKLITAKTKEMANYRASALQTTVDFEDLWLGDHRPHNLELPDGTVEIRIEDEGGKINLNLASEALLNVFFVILRLSKPQIQTMVNSILDWRERGEVPRPYGAKSAYYLGLDPPYVAKNRKFETVEELAWVHGFEASPLIPRLSRWLTVHGSGREINLNTAPVEVLQALGFPEDSAQNIMVARQSAPLRNLPNINQPRARALMNQRFSFRSTPFFTIISTGRVKQDRGGRTIKAIVRLELTKKKPWLFLSWYDGFPG